MQQISTTTVQASHLRRTHSWASSTSSPTSIVADTWGDLARKAARWMLRAGPAEPDLRPPRKIKRIAAEAFCDFQQTLLDEGMPALPYCPRQYYNPQMPFPWKFFRAKKRIIDLTFSVWA